MDSKDQRKAFKCTSQSQRTVGGMEPSQSPVNGVKALPDEVYTSSDALIAHPGSGESAQMTKKHLWKSPKESKLGVPWKCSKEATHQSTEHENQGKSI